MAINNNIIPGFDEEKDDSLKISLDKVSDLPNCIRIYLNGYIDTYNSNFFQKKIAKVIEAGFINIIFNCTALTYADNTFDADVNNPFAFAVGVSKQFKAMKKPTVYAQFVYNMDPFKHFGDGQDQLNLDGANVNGSVAKEGAGNIDAVDWYDGRAAVRVGIRWDI